jgi:hypothetical protein
MKQSQAESERGFRPSPSDDIKQYDSKKNAQIKQSQAESERGSVLRPGVTPDKIEGKMTQKAAKSERGFRPSPRKTRTRIRIRIRKRTIKTTIRKKRRRQGKDKDKERESQG